MMKEMSILIMIFSFLLLLFLSAFFSGSETALMAISRLRLKHLAETRPRRTRIIESMLKEPDKLIGTILLGNNLVNVAMTALATSLAITFWGQKGIVYVTAVLTLVILIFAEITPKVYAKYFNERVSYRVAPVLKLIMIFFKPAVVTVTFISNKILNLIGLNLKNVKTPLITEAELKTFIKVSKETGAITLEEKKMLTRVFTLNDKAVEEVMLPAKRMVILDKDAPKEEILKTILKTGHSRFPVRGANKSDIVGTVLVKDIFQSIEKRKSMALKKILRPAYFVSDEDKIDGLLRGFQRKKIHQAVVLNEKGEIVGLITLEDILEELVGSIEDEHD